MCAVVRIDDGSFWIGAHAASAKQVHGKLLFVHWMRPFFQGTSSVEELERTVTEPVHEFEVIRMISVGHAQSGEAPSVLEIRVQRETICFERQRGASGVNFHGSREVVTQCRLKTATPARRGRWETT